MKLRKIFQNPRKIIKPYVKAGMTVLDMGCGPGYFTIEMARLVGSKGKVVAADLQEGMLEIIREKIKDTGYQSTIELNKCESDRTGISAKFDFILIFYMLHEVPVMSAFLKEIDSLLKPDGKILIVEPIFHVSKKEFNNTTGILKELGFKIIEEPKICFSRSAAVNKFKKTEKF